MRLIDADLIGALLYTKFTQMKELINQGENYLDNFTEGLTEAAGVIRNMPTVDAVPVVRCKDCTEWDELSGECSHWYGFRENDFCSYGERKDGDTP